MAEVKLSPPRSLGSEIQEDFVPVQQRRLKDQIYLTVAETPKFLEKVLPVAQKTGKFVSKGIELTQHFTNSNKGDFVINHLDTANTCIEAYGLIGLINYWTHPLSQPIVKNIYMLFFTAAAIGEHIIVRFNVLKLIDYAKKAQAIGDKIPVFQPILQASSKTVLRSIASGGLGIRFGESIYNLVKAESRQARIKRAWETGISGLSFGATAIPLIFAVSPPVVLALGLASQGIGLLSIYFKPTD